MSRAMRKTSTVKWFSHEKGFGFLVVDGLDGDVLLNRTALLAAGLVAIKVGARVNCEVIRKIKGLQVRTIYAVDDPGDQTPPVPPPARPREVIRDPPMGPALVAQVKWFSRPKGYGFVTTGEGDDDAYLHMDVMRRFGLRAIKQGQRVLVRIVAAGPKGRTVVEVRDFPDDIPAGKRRREASEHAPPTVGTRHGVVGELLFVDVVRGFGVVALADMDDVAFADIELLRAVGALDPETCGELICDIEFRPPLIAITHISAMGLRRRAIH